MRLAVPAGTIARSLALAACILALPILGGCASWIVEDEQITLQHVQQPGIQPVPGAANVTLSVQVNDKRDYLAPGISRKWGLAVVGYGRNGLGEETYPNIIVSEPVALTFRKAAESELRARGFRIGGSANRGVVIDIHTFFNDYKVGFFRSEAVADLKMDVRILTQAGKMCYARAIIVQGHKVWATTMDAQGAAVALNQALDNGIKTLFDDSVFVSALLARGCQQA